MGNIATKRKHAETTALASRSNKNEKDDTSEPKVPPADSFSDSSQSDDPLIYPKSLSVCVEKGIKQTDGTDGETKTRTETYSIVSSVSDSVDYSFGLRIKPWDRKKMYSEFIRDGLRALGESTKDVIMLYESPSSSDHQVSFFNSQSFKLHDYPSPPTFASVVLQPCRYVLVNGSTYPSYLKNSPPEGLIDHWKATVPGFVEPTFVSKITSRSKVYAYLPVEHIANHVIDPYVHYHLAGKDVLHLMTKKTTKLLANTQDERPCVCKMTHSFGSLGVFVIRNDKDEEAFNQFLKDSGYPTYIITEYIEIERNVACHFFIHPSGELTWFGCNENRRMADGNWSSDSTIAMADQEELKEIQLPFVKDVVRYCHFLGFWGFCGIDVLFDTNGKGHLVDVNPRVTGSCPAIMVAHLLNEKYGFEYCLFRRSSKFAFPGSAKQLLQQVEAYNKEHEGKSMVVINGFCPAEEAGTTMVNIIVVSATSLEECEQVLDRFAPLQR